MRYKVYKFLAQCLDNIFGYTQYHLKVNMFDVDDAFEEGYDEGYNRALFERQSPTIH